MIKDRIKSKQPSDRQSPIEEAIFHICEPMLRGLYGTLSYEDFRRMERTVIADLKRPPNGQPAIDPIEYVAGVLGAEIRTLNNKLKSFGGK